MGIALFDSAPESRGRLCHSDFPLRLINRRTVNEKKKLLHAHQLLGLIKKAMNSFRSSEVA
jgi:hypothetical protein